MEDLKKFNEKFEEIKNNNNLSANKKSIEYARLMTELEKTYNIPIAQNEEFDNLQEDVKELYLKISNERNWLINKKMI